MALPVGPAVAGPRDEEFANVAVLVRPLGNSFAYTYTVENHGIHPIAGFSIGSDHHTGTSELSGEHSPDIVSPAAWRRG